MAINKENATKLNEQTRRYTFPGGDVVEIQKVTELIVSTSGNHRLKSPGKLHIVPPGWIHIEIESDEWKV